MKNTLIALVVPLIIFASCTRRIYVPVTDVGREYVHDSVRIRNLRYDSIVRIDSVIIEQRGDTIFHTTLRDRYHLRQRVDTLHLLRIDTVEHLHTVTIPAASPSKALSRPLRWLLPAFLLVILLLCLRRHKNRKNTTI